MSQQKALFHFYGELCDFFPGSDSGYTRGYVFDGNPSVKDAIEAIGVPHTEVNAIVVNGASVGFGYHLNDGDRIYVYPVSLNPAVQSKVSLRSEPSPRFIVDANLGKLARLLRMLGFDAVYRNDFTDHDVAALADKKGRIVLSRDRRLLRFKVIAHGYWLRSDDPPVQIREVIKRFGLQSLIKPFNRCLECNGVIESVEKESILERLEPKTILYFDDFFTCSECGKIYWKGSHYDHMNETLEMLKKS